MPSLLARLPASWQQRYRRWLDRRIPPHSEVQFNQRNLFIFLSGEGAWFLVLVALVWIGATNFQNNLAYGLSFFLLAVMFVAILQTFANASGLRLRFIDAEPVFAGDEAQVRFALSSTAAHYQIALSWPEHAELQVSVLANTPQQVFLPLNTQRRGWLRPGRLRLQTVYPLGIVRCWSWVDLDVQVLVYPATVPEDYHLCSSGDAQDDGGGVVAGGDEYYALKPYREGESRSRIAWKQFAAGRGLFVREYAQWRGGEVMLDYAVVPDPDVETRLSKLCYCALQLHEQGRSYGLRLPGQPEIAIGAGDAHLRNVLTALALFPA